MEKGLSKEEVKWLKEIAEELGVSYPIVEKAYINITSGKEPETMLEEFIRDWLEMVAELDQEQEN